MIPLALTLLLAAGAQDGPAPDFTLPDLEGTKQTLSEVKGAKATVLIFGGIECPRSLASEGRLSDMAAEFGKAGVAFRMINSNWNEPVEAIREHLKGRDFPIPVLKDADNRVADQYGIEVQPTVVLLDAGLRVRYRGAIDDHKTEEFVRNPYLRRAIEAVVAGRPVKVAKTRPEGCFVRKEAPEATSTEVTYARDVAPILNRNCVTCHRPGQVGLFSLRTYAQAKAWSAEIADYTGRREMPPWKPSTNHGAYYNERRLTDGEIAALAKWNEIGAPLGDAEKVPEPPAFSDDWMLGEPDAVLKAEGGYVIRAKGNDEYRCYVIRNPFDEDVWLEAVEYRPGNMRVVHHIIAYLDRQGSSIPKDEADPAPGYRSNGSGPMFIPSGSIGGWAPGNMPRRLPEGVGRRIRKGEHVVLETHYHKSGREETDAGHEVALYFAKKPVKRMLRYQMMANPLLRIPPGAERHRVRTMPWRVPRDLHALDVMPHMHLLGREMSVWAEFPDGTKKDLVVVKDWDFNWQETYQFREPLALPKGTRIRLEAYYDNSENNPNNPNHPPRAVRWGEETTDEMCIAFVGFVIDSEDRTGEGR